MGNGQPLHIKNTNSGKLSTLSHTFNLSKILHTPKLSVFLLLILIGSSFRKKSLAELSILVKASMVSILFPVLLLYPHLPCIPNLLISMQNRKISHYGIFVLVILLQKSLILFYLALVYLCALPFLLAIALVV